MMQDVIDEIAIRGEAGIVPIFDVRTGHFGTSPSSPPSKITWKSLRIVRQVYGRMASIRQVRKQRTTMFIM